MKMLAKKITIIIIILIVVDFSLGKILDYALHNSPDGRYYKANYSLNYSDEDVIIFGSSRAETNYSPIVFRDSLKLTCWNTGRGGQTLPFWHAMQKGILDRYSPKIAIINLERDFLSIDLKSAAYERAGFLRPFYYKNLEIRSIMNKISRFEKFYLSSKVYAYNSSYYYLFRPYLISGLDGDIEDNGWKTNPNEMEDLQVPLKKFKTNYNINKNTLKLFQEFISDFTDIGCEVIVVFSPNYGYSTVSTSTIKYVEKMKNITLLNYSRDSVFINNPKFYKDHEHLNTHGATEYSKKISSNILSLGLSNFKTK